MFLNNQIICPLILLAYLNIYIYIYIYIYMYIIVIKVTERMKF